MEEIKICNSSASLRKSKGCTKIELLNLTNLSQQYISNVEVILPSIYKTIILADALGECYCNIFYKYITS